MSHNINSMMYVGERPWHGLGTELKDAATSAQAIDAANLAWEVESRSVFVNLTQKPGAFTVIPNKRAIVRKDTGHVFNVMGDGYTPVQNKEAFSFFDDVVGQGQAIYHTAGALGQGERVWILAKLPGELRISGTDDITEKFLLLSNSHDGTSVLRMFFTPIRVVCQNTLNLALKGRGQGEGITLRHTANVLRNVQNAQNALGLAIRFYDTMGETMNILAQSRITREAFKAYVKTLIPDNENAERHTRTDNIRESIADRFFNGKGNQGRSLWDAVNAVSEYVDHDRSARGTGLEQVSNRLESQWFGSGAKLKAEAWDLALDTAGIKLTN